MSDYQAEFFYPSYWEIFTELQRNSRADGGSGLQKQLQSARMVAINKLEQAFLLTLLQEDQAPLSWQTWFWFNHFNVDARKLHVGAVIASYWHDAIYSRLGTSFTDLLKAVTMHPAMLMYLDNARSRQARPNENHARELLELHTLGLGSGYSQADIAAVAHILTGWSVNLRGDPSSLGSTVFLPNLHSRGAKQVMGKTITGTLSAELIELLDWLAMHPATAQRIAQRLAEWHITDHPSPVVVDMLAQTYLRSRGDLAVIWQTAQRLGEQAMRGIGMVPRKFKSPLQYLVSAVRALACDSIVVDARPLQRWLRVLGQPVFSHAAPDGYPLKGAAWQSAGQLAQRIELAREIVLVVPRMLERQHGRVSTSRSSQRPRVGPEWLVGLSPVTRQVVEQADSAAQGWALLLTSPEFMMVGS